MATGEKNGNRDEATDSDPPKLEEIFTTQNPITHETVHLNTKSRRYLIHDDARTCGFCVCDNNPGG